MRHSKDFPIAKGTVYLKSGHFVSKCQSKFYTTNFSLIYFHNLECYSSSSTVFTNALKKVRSDKMILLQGVLLSVILQFN